MIRKKDHFSNSSPRVYSGKNVVMTNQAIPVVRAHHHRRQFNDFCGTAFDPPVEMLKNYGVDISAETEEMRQDVPINPLPDELMGAGPQAFLNSAQDMGYDAHKLNHFIYPTKCKLNCQLCMYGCPYGAKWDARSFVGQSSGKRRKNDQLCQSGESDH